MQKILLTREEVVSFFMSFSYVCSPFKIMRHFDFFNTWFLLYTQMHTVSRYTVNQSRKAKINTIQFEMERVHKNIKYWYPCNHAVVVFIGFSVIDQTSAILQKALPTKWRFGMAPGSSCSTTVEPMELRTWLHWLLLSLFHFFFSKVKVAPYYTDE